jgi:FAD/FMN-containing dehydrogenase
MVDPRPAPPATRLADAAVTVLRTQLRGPLLSPSDDGYDAARTVWNGMIDRRPALIARCAGAADVIAAVTFAREHHLLLAIKGGGHNVAGKAVCDDGLLLDLSLMKGIRVDPVAQTVRAEPGLTWGEVDAEAQAFGLATIGVDVSSVGIAGVTVGGGFGWLVRSHGLACDTLRSVDLVTADGRLLTASATEHPELFWSVRGGGGNFGVVTAFEYDLHPVRDVYGGPILFELSDAADVLRLYREFIRDAPEEFGGFPAWQIAPPLPFIPEDRQGEPFLIFVTCWAGSIEDGEAALKPIRDVAPVVAEHVGPMPYPAINSAFDGLVPAGLQHYWKANFVTELTDDAIAAHLAHGPRVPTVNSTVHIYPINGACHRVAPDATAFAYRDATFATVIAGMWPDPADNDANTAWVRGFYDATAPHSEAGGYVNFMAGDDQERIKDNYKGNYDRLVDVKRTYDPGNLFRHNQNIKP